MYTTARWHLLLECVFFCTLFVVLRKRDDYLHPFNLVCYLFAVQYAIPGVLLVADPHSAFAERWGMLSTVVLHAGWAMLLVNVFVVMLAVGFRRSLALPLLDDGWEWDWVGLRILSTGLLVLFCCLMLYFAVGGGVAQLVNQYRLATGSGWINIFVILAAHMLPMILWSAGKRAPAAGAALLIFAFLMLSGGRLAAVVAIFWFLLFIYYRDQRDWIRWLLVALPLLLLLSVFVVLRPHVQELPLASVLAYNWRYLFLTEIGRLEQLSLYLWYSVEHMEFTLGMQWVRSVLGPFLSGALDYIDYRNAISARIFGLDPSTFRAGMGGTGVADLWIGGGPAAVVLGPLLYGCVWRRFYDYMRESQTAFSVLLYINVTAFFYQAVQEMFTVGILFYTVAPLLLFSVVCRLRPAGSRLSGRLAAARSTP